MPSVPLSMEPDNQASSFLPYCRDPSCSVDYHYFRWTPPAPASYWLFGCFFSSMRMSFPAVSRLSVDVPLRSKRARHCMVFHSDMIAIPVTSLDEFSAALHDSNLDQEFIIQALAGLVRLAVAPNVRGRTTESSDPDGWLSQSMENLFRKVRSHFGSVCQPHFTDFGVM